MSISDNPRKINIGVPVLAILGLILGIMLVFFAKNHEKAESVRFVEASKETDNVTSYESNTVAQKEGSVQVVASKSSKKYHYLWCSGAKRIKEENKVFFKSPTEAEKAGLTLAINCKPKKELK